MFNGLGLGLKETDIFKLQKVADKDLDGTVSFSEFAPIAMRQLNKAFADMKFDNETDIVAGSATGSASRGSMIRSGSTSGSGDKNKSKKTPWVRLFDPSSGCPYYMHRLTNKTEWVEYCDTVNDSNTDSSKTLKKQTQADRIGVVPSLILGGIAKQNMKSKIPPPLDVYIETIFKEQDSSKKDITSTSKDSTDIAVSDSTDITVNEEETNPNNNGNNKDNGNVNGDGNNGKGSNGKGKLDGDELWWFLHSLGLGLTDSDFRKLSELADIDNIDDDGEGGGIVWKNDYGMRMIKLIKELLNSRQYEIYEENPWCLLTDNTAVPSGSTDDATGNDATMSTSIVTSTTNNTGTTTGGSAGGGGVGAAIGISGGKYYYNRQTQESEWCDGTKEQILKITYPSSSSNKKQLPCYIGQVTLSHPEPPSLEEYMYGFLNKLANKGGK